MFPFRLDADDARAVGVERRAGGRDVGSGRAALEIASCGRRRPRAKRGTMSGPRRP